MRQSNRRGTELMLLVFALVLVVLGMLQVGWATGTAIPTRLWVTMALLAALAAGMHMVVRLRATYADPILLPAATLLTGLGLVMIYRIDVANAQRAVHNNITPPTPDVYAQLTWFAIAAVLFVAVLILVRDHRRLQRYTFTFGLIGIVLLILPLAPVLGHTINGARLWVRLAVFSFQPGELAKIALTIFFAGYLVLKRDSRALVRTRVAGVGVPRVKDLGPILIAWLISLGVLVFQNDLGTSLLFFALFVSMLYIATGRRSWLIWGAVLFAVGSLASWALIPHVHERVTIWLNPFGYAADSGYQIVQSLYGFANGGLLGAGLGQGFPTLVPFANTDFITAAFGEELGLIGLMAMLMVYAIIVERGMRISVSVKDSFGQLLAAGLSISVAIQVFVIIGGVTRLIPLTGLTTPFLSYGGSSLVANWIIIALLLRISDRARRPDTQAPAMDDAMTQVVRRV